MLGMISTDLVDEFAAGWQNSTIFVAISTLELAYDSRILTQVYSTYLSILLLASFGSAFDF